ncbi:MAG: hypothetical protein K2X27_18335 [Candidatus Obscuribacterales bacterium]|nr:hypothetical protein [Candidatus Obscuribacterales bacterium]
MHYLHTQKVPEKVLAAATIAGLAIGLTPPGFLARLALMGVLGAAAYSFRSLTIEVDDEEIKLQFGDGPIRKSFLLADISSAKAVRTTPLQGWGIHWTGHGWLYNIYGLDAVEICMTNGKRALIGTDEPDKLEAAIDGRLIVVH